MRDVDFYEGVNLFVKKNPNEWTRNFVKTLIACNVETMHKLESLSEQVEGQNKLLEAAIHNLQDILDKE